MSKVFYWCPVCNALHPYLVIEVAIYAAGDGLEEIGFLFIKIENGKAFIEEERVKGNREIGGIYVNVRCPENNSIWEDEANCSDLPTTEELVEEYVKQFEVRYHGNNRFEIGDAVDLTEEELKKAFAKVV